MSDTESTPAATPPPRNLWTVVGIGLVVAVLMLFVAGAALAIAVRDSGAPTSTTRLVIANFALPAASTINAALLLGAMLALTEAARASAEPRRLRPWFVVVFAAGVIIVLACALAIWNYATVSSSDFSGGGLLGSQTDWKHRLSQILPYVAAALLATVALVLANARAPISESLESEATPPD